MMFLLARRYWCLIIVGCAFFTLCDTTWGGDISSSGDPDGPRIFILSSSGGCLSPSGTNGHDAARVDPSTLDFDHILTLKGVAGDVLWSTDRPEHRAGTKNMEDWVSVQWPLFHGKNPANAVLDTTIDLQGGKESLCLTVKNPRYDSSGHTLTFDAAILNSTLKDGLTAPVDMTEIKMTIVDKNKNDRTTGWSFVHTAREASFETTGRAGVYRLHLDGIQEKAFYMSRSPDHKAYGTPLVLFVRSWNDRFCDFPPNATLTSHGPDGSLKTDYIILSAPQYDEAVQRLTFTARLRFGSAHAVESLSSPTLIIEAASTRTCESGSRNRLIICNNCGEDVWMYFTPPGLLPEQWDFWLQYGEKRYLNPNVPSAGFKVRTILPTGDTQEFCIPDKGAPSGNFSFYIGCDPDKDNSQEWGDCVIGSRPGFDLIGVNTLFEPTFGCKYGDPAACALNTATSPYTPLSQVDWYDISAVDGFTLPLRVEVTNPDGLGCNRTFTDAGMLDLASCPCESNRSLYSTNAEQQAVIEQGIALLTTDNRGQRACPSPCKWFSSSTLGSPNNPVQMTQGETDPPVNTSCYYCCGNKCFKAADASDCDCPGCGGTQCVQGPERPAAEGGGAFPVSRTEFVRRLKEMGYRGYTWAYDDSEGLMNCASGYSIVKVTLCPLGVGDIPYDVNRKWTFTDGQCTPGSSGSYSSLFECQKANMKYSCITQQIDADKSPPGPIYKYCQVDPDGRMTYNQCQWMCRDSGFLNLPWVDILLDNDQENDGMPDDWEVANGLNPNVNDADLDPDGDGLTNLQEYQNGTNPQEADTDWDGMPDGWEAQNGLNPKVNDCNGDLDQDGWTNCEEYRFGTDPRNSQSHPSRALPFMFLLVDE